MTQIQSISVSNVVR